MKLEVAIKTRMINLCKERHITINKLSTMAGITQSTLDSIVHGKSMNPTTMTILRICRALDMELYQFFKDDIFKGIDND